MNRNSAGNNLSNFAILILAFMFMNAPNSFSQDVHIVKSRDISPYDLAIKGFISSYGNNVKVSDIEGDTENGKRIAKKLNKEKPDVIIAVGTLAAVSLKEVIKDTPVVCLLISRPEKYFKKSSNYFGVGINPDPVKQLELVKKVIPGTSKIGIIHTIGNPNRAIERANSESGKLGMQIIEQHIDSSSELQDALIEIRKKTDLLLLVVDEVVISEPAIEHIIKFSISHRYPIVGFSKKIVMSGALMSSISDYEEMGAQAAEMVNKILNGKMDAKERFEYPVSSKYVINIRSSELLNVVIPEELFKGANEIYK